MTKARLPIPNDRPFEFSQRVEMDLDPFSDVSPDRCGNLEGVRRHLLQAAGESPRIAVRIAPASECILPLQAHDLANPELHIIKTPLFHLSNCGR